MLRVVGEAMVLQATDEFLVRAGFQNFLKLASVIPHETHASGPDIVCLRAARRSDHPLIHGVFDFA